MLAGWLDRHDPSGERRRTGGIARAVVTVADRAVPEIETFCARRELSVQRSTRAGGRWAVLVLEGKAPLVQGLTEVTGMSRR